MSRLPRTLCLSVILAGALGASPAANAAPDATIQTGQWRTTTTTSELTNPMLQPEQIARIKSKPVVVTYCVKSTSLRALIVGSDTHGLCSGDVTFDNGKIAGSRTCTTGLGKGTRSFSGTYTDTKYELDTSTTQAMPQGPASSKKHSLNERIAAKCTGM